MCRAGDISINGASLESPVTSQIHEGQRETDRRSIGKGAKPREEKPATIISFASLTSIDFLPERRTRSIAIMTEKMSISLNLNCHVC